MPKYPRTDPPHLLLLDTRLPWTQTSFEAVRDAIGISRPSGIELDQVTVAAIVRTLAGEMTAEEAISNILRHYGVSKDI